MPVHKCPVCGKRTVILYPQLWVYKRFDTYFCSWSCLRAYDRKGEINMTSEQRQAVIDMATRGESPMKFIRECGNANPPATWYNIKSTLKKNNPEIYAKIPKSFKPVETPEKPATVKVDGPLVIETPEANQIRVSQPIQPTVAVNFGGYEVTAINHPDLGEFYHDKKYRTIDWRSPDGEEVSLTADLWKQLAEAIPEMMGILGVSV